jgi:hypothetical protein
MYILRKPVALTGIFISALAPVFLPFLKVPVKGNWNLYQTDVSLFFVTYGLLALCVLAFFLRNVTFYRLCSKLYLGWCVVDFLAVYFKIHNYFGLKFVDGLLSQSLHLKWGWIVLFAGSLILLFSVQKNTLTSVSELGNEA